MFQFGSSLSSSYQHNEVPDDVQHRQPFSEAALVVPSEQCDQRIRRELLAAQADPLHVVVDFGVVYLYQSFTDVDENHHAFSRAILHEVEIVLVSADYREDLLCDVVEQRYAVLCVLHHAVDVVRDEVHALEVPSRLFVLSHEVAQDQLYFLLTRKYFVELLVFLAGPDEVQPNHVAVVHRKLAVRCCIDFCVLGYSVLRRISLGSAACRWTVFQPSPLLLRALLKGLQLAVSA